MLLCVFEQPSVTCYRVTGSNVSMAERACSINTAFTPATVLITIQVRLVVPVYVPCVDLLPSSIPFYLLFFHLIHDLINP